MNQRRRLQRVAWSLVIDELLGNCAELSVHLIQQGTFSGLTSRSDLLKQLRDLVGLTGGSFQEVPPYACIIARDLRFS